jgi:hypothetical protein
VELSMRQCRLRGFGDIAQQLDDALHISSSGLEVVGEIKGVFVAHAARLETVVGREKCEEVVAFVNTAYGVE